MRQAPSHARLRSMLAEGVVCGRRGGVRVGERGESVETMYVDCQTNRFIWTWAWTSWSCRHLDSRRLYYDTEEATGQEGCLDIWGWSSSPIRSSLPIRRQWYYVSGGGFGLWCFCSLRIGNSTPAVPPPLQLMLIHTNATWLAAEIIG